VALRRHFHLSADDQGFLDEYGLPWETLVDGPQWVLIHDFPTVAGYNHSLVTAAIRLETGYPNTELNMVYFFPALARADGKAVGATQATQQIDGRMFQRWSRHRTAQNPWKAGRDNIGTHILLVEDWLAREFGR
jgi:hypothetical protein